jgi:ABC-type bacteriocin/lantibiotic exporter with double-glycine peptidase domain
MLGNYITFAISICFISWLFAIMVNSVLIKFSCYSKLGYFNFIRGKQLNKILGIYAIKWILRNTFFKYFNQAIKIEAKDADLNQLRDAMTGAEISHLIGFIFVMIFVVYMSISQSLLFGIIILVFNLLMNLYPSLLEQENKRRLDRLIQRQARLSAMKTDNS